LDEIPIGLLFAVLIALLFCSAFFSGSETALMALNRYRLRHLAQQGHPGARRAQYLLSRPDRLIGLILLGNNFVNILITQLATLIGYRLYGNLGIAIAGGVLTLVILILAEVAPKTLAALHSERVAYPSAFVYVPLLTVLQPVVWTVNLLANSVLRLFRVPEAAAGSQALSREELRTVVREAGSLIPRRHQHMLISILDLEKATVEDIMVPRNEIVGIDLEDEWDDIVQQIIRSSYTRVPVFRSSIDNVEGFLHLRNVLPLIHDEDFQREDLEGVLREASFIPEGTPLNRQLLNFQRERRRMGLVVDEYGEIMGLVTLEDLLEEIVGEFTNDPSDFAQDVTPQQDGSYLVDGGTHIRDLNRVFGMHLRSDGPRTVNGLVLEHMEAIPEPGTTLLIDGYPVEIVQSKNNAVKTVRIKPRLAHYQAEDEQPHG
jgi:Mg2+/Co2+ transporter CorB